MATFLFSIILNQTIEIIQSLKASLIPKWIIVSCSFNEKCANQPHVGMVFLKSQCPFLIIT